MFSIHLQQQIRRLPFLVLSFVAVNAYAQTSIESLDGVWAVDGPAACVTTPYRWLTSQSGDQTIVRFTDAANKVNVEQVVATQDRGFTTATLASPTVPVGARWDYTVQDRNLVLVRNLSNGRAFKLVRCVASLEQAAAVSTAAPTFSDPLTLIAWLLANSGNGFEPLNDASTGNVFSPGLRDAVRSSVAHSRAVNEPPCGANGDFILETQEMGRPINTRLAVQTSAVDRAAVSASYDVDGHHRTRRYMVVNLGGAWKLENIQEANGSTLRRSLACR